MRDDYDFGPSPLSDEEMTHMEDLFRYSRTEMESLILRSIDPRATEQERAAAKRCIEEIRK